MFKTRVRLAIASEKVINRFYTSTFRFVNMLRYCIFVYSYLRFYCCTRR